MSVSEAIAVLPFLLVLVPSLLLGLILWRTFRADGKKAGKQPDAQELLLVTGVSRYAERLCRMLDSEHLPYEYSAMGSCRADLRYSWLLAMDESDEQNLTTGSCLGRMSGIGRQILLCNDPIYQNLFRQTGKNYVLASEPPEKIIAIIMKRGHRI